MPPKPELPAAETGSLRDALASSAAPLPPEIRQALAKLPPNVDRRTGADLVRYHFFPVSYRTLEAWPLPTRRVNGKAIISTVRLFEVAFAKLAAAPIIMSGRKATSDQRVI